MAGEKTLERTWDASYPEGGRQKLWPEMPVPMVEFSKAHFRPGAMILDLPCGDGKNISALAEIGPILGADWSERAVNLCNSTCHQAGLRNVVTMEADVFDLPFADATFESIFCCDLLGHLPEASRALVELRRILKPGGTLVATLFSERDSVLNDLRMRKGEDGTYWFQEKWFFRFYDADAAQAVCEAAGFATRAIEEFSWWEDPHPGYREYRHKHASWALALKRA